MMLGKRYKKGIIFFVLLFLLLCCWFNLPDPLFETTYSTVLSDKEGNIIGVTVAEDEQYRFPEVKSLPLKYVAALTVFEDKRFWQHRGVDWDAFLRAAYQNFSEKRIVSGGSTITMQLVRLSRKNPPRTIWEKCSEMLLALRIEMQYSKWEILCLYASHAPFGSNIVGMRAAALKYFNRSHDELSWAEAAFLAILPNAPSLKNRTVLLKKRDRLLLKLCTLGYIQPDDYQLALSEPLPEKIFSNEHVAPHLLGRASLQHKGKYSRSFIDSRLQQQVNEIVNRHAYSLSSNHIYNAAAIVAHIPTGEVRAYVGNTSALPGSSGNNVDIIHSLRSSGSILKPALYALMLQNGYVLPGMLVADIPSRFGGYAPSNFSKTFQGVVPARKALTMSLNIPFVRMLKDYSYHRFYEELKQLGITTLTRDADDYGLSMILGGGETSLWEICNMYAGMVSVVRHYNENDGDYFAGEYNRLKLWDISGELKTQIPPPKIAPANVLLDAASIGLTLKALKEVERPEMESGWKRFASGIDLSWKTGTSFGFRDGWAVGVNADWVVGVWVGNADGEGRPGLTGVRVAAPILFEIARILPVEGKLTEAHDELTEVVVCKHSGYRASEICEEKDTIKVSRNGIRTATCPYHRLIHLDESGQWRVNSTCERVHRMQTRSWFVLPPVQEWYYARVNSAYRRLPPFRSDCRPVDKDVMEMIYPQRGAKVFIPRDFGGKKGKVVFELAHRNPDMEVYWHIDDQYIGMTQHIHQMDFDINEGWHALHLIDNNGDTLTQEFNVVGE